MEDQRQLNFVLAYVWSTNNIGDIGITPGMLSLLSEYLPEIKHVYMLSNSGRSSGDFRKQTDYYPAIYPICEIVPKPFRDNRKYVEAVFASPHRFLRSLEDECPEYVEAFSKADFVLYNSGTLLSYGRGGSTNWQSTLYFALPLLLANRLGIPYGVYAHSFEAFAWPSNIFFQWLLSEAEFVFARDTDSLSQLRKIGVNAPDMRYMPDAAFAFSGEKDAAWAKSFFAENGLKPGEFTTATIRTSGQGYITKEREAIHMKKMAQIIEDWVNNTGMKVLICPEVRYELEPARDLLYPLLSDKAKKNSVLMDEFWTVEQATAVYSQARIVMSMEIHSIILALSENIPIVHPPFAEAGRKRQMIADIGLGDWLFDLDKDDARDISAAMKAISDNWDEALARTRKAMDDLKILRDEGMKVLATKVRKSTRGPRNYE